MSTPVLHVEHITMQFGGVVAVNDLSMDIYPGEIVALIGPNGAGKTTAFNCITGVYEPTNGRVDFMGEPIVHHDQLRLGHKRAANGQHLLFAARECPGLLPLALFQPREQVIYAGQIVCEGVLAQICADAQVFRHSQVFKYTAALRHKRDTARDDLIGRFSNQIRTVQENFTRFRLDQSGNCLQGGRFACTVRADEGDNFAFLDLQINTFDGLNAAIGDDQIFDFQNVTHPRPPPDTRR